MKMTAPPCTACGGIFACVRCEQTLRKQLRSMHEVDHLMMNAGDSSGVHHFFDETKAKALYATSYPVGPRRGAMIDLGRAVVLECFAPYRDDAGTLPFVPMPFDGTTLLHDIGRRKDLDPREIERCKAGLCDCDTYPTGWVLPRAAVRALLNVTDSYLNDHGRQLPGLIGGSWALLFDTVSFMGQCYFNTNFVLPTRKASRRARSHRARLRSSPGWTRAQPAKPHRRRR